MTILNSPGIVLLDREDRRCIDKPTWWWFASPPVHSDPPRAMWDDPTFKKNDSLGRFKEAHERALITCTYCPLVLTCLQASWDTESHGTYGGLSELERWAFGGRGHHGGNQSRTPERRAKILARITKRFGSDQHPVVRWLAARPAAVPNPVGRPKAA